MLLCQVAPLDGARAGATRLVEVTGFCQKSYGWARWVRPPRLMAAPTGFRSPQVRAWRLTGSFPAFSRHRSLPCTPSCG